MRFRRKTIRPSRLEDSDLVGGGGRIEPDQARSPVPEEFQDYPGSRFVVDEQGRGTPGDLDDIRPKTEGKPDRSSAA